ncbi:Phosphoenolpyruvate/pyruvate domain-containing protein [Agrocybe pediades]|nr:Phosphoenolpyruvate/pyruvate domain-containing protein [Agrocybe pediades]
MQRFSQFLPDFSGNRQVATTDKSRANDSKSSFDVVQTGHDTDGSDQDKLLGLPRVMRDARKQGKPVLGFWMMFPGAALARTFAQLGYDFILIDCEHGNIDDAAMHAAVGAVAAEGVSPLVRIPGPDNVHVKRALDSGAHGILCPNLSSVEEARALVSYAKFPIPTKTVPGQSSDTKNNASVISRQVSGIRGVGSPFAPAVFHQSLGEYIRTANRNTLVAAQIETLAGLENCEEIAKVDGLDMLFIGPNDLASSMGYPALEHESIPEVQDAVERVLAAAHAAGKYAGMFCTSSEQVRRRHEQGFDLMNLGGDIVALQAWNANELAKIEDIRKGPII